MGHRANLVLVEGGSYRLYYCHWCAKSIPNDIFWGPHYAIPFINTQQSVNNDESGWLDEVWAEGGLLVDSDRRYLLLYGGEDLKYDIRLRRVYLGLLQLAWPDWTIEWAHDGIAEIARYVGVQIPETRDDVNPATLEAPQEKEWVSFIGSFVLEDGALRLFPLGYFASSEALLTGPGLLEDARQRPGFESLQLDDWLKPNDFPAGGFHIDVPKRQIVYWSAHDPDQLQHIQGAWPGWDVRWLEDRYEDHLALTGGKLIFPAYAVGDLLARLEGMLLSDSSHAINAFLSFIQRMSEEGKDMQINPNALSDQPQEITVAVRKQLFDDLLEQWKAANRDPNI